MLLLRLIVETKALTPQDSRRPGHGHRLEQQLHLAAWNLKHRSRRIGIPSRALDAISALDIDVLVLPQCADGRHLSKFREGLKDMGFDYIASSVRAPQQTVVLIASRYPMSNVGLLPMPGYTEAAATNWLHRRFPNHGLEIVGFRAPTYPSAADHAGYWGQFESIVRSSRGRRIVFIGDFGLDPSSNTDQCSGAFPRLHHEGFHLADPKGDWSRHAGAPDSVGMRCDHALAGPTLSLRAARYVYTAGGVTLAASARNSCALSDHALLSIWLTVPPGVAEPKPASSERPGDHPRVSAQA